MAGNPKDDKRSARAERRARERAAEEARRAQEAKDRRTQTIIGIIVTVIVVALIAVACVMVYRSTHKSSETSSAATSVTKEEAYKELQAVTTKPSRADEQGGILVSKDGYGKAVKDVPTIAMYMDFMCPGCGSMHRNIDAAIVKMVDAGQVNFELHFMSFMDSLSTDEYSSRAANMALTIAEKDDDPDHLLKFLENMYAEDFQPEEGSGYKSVSDQEIRQQATKAGVSAEVANEGVTRQYDDWLSAINTYTPKRSELWNVSGSLKGSMSTPTITINGYFWNYNDSSVSSKSTMVEALCDAIGLKQSDIGKEGVLPSIGATGKPLIGAVDEEEQKNSGSSN
ncbi:MAG: thioredoxin domain-containing protein [Bifidobacterium sp.]|nr:thioredoxin domain-containing protein [Bifidobacterium sp.]